MIIGSGVDIVEVPRVRQAIDKWGDNFLKKVFTDEEIKYSNRRRHSYQHFAARFAAKEACLKAFGIPRGYVVRWTDIEVLNNSHGRPKVRFHSEAKRLVSHAGVESVIISMSHSKDYAIANAILLSGDRKP